MPRAQRSAIVTGGARRVGRALVQMLADEGFTVVYTTRGRAGGAVSRRPNVRAVTLDFEDPEAAAGVLASLVRDQLGGRLDVLVHNASAYEPGELSALTLQQLRSMHRVHVEAPVLITQALAAPLRKSRGRVITMLDITTERPMPSYLAYCASKAALANATLSLARALAPEVTVNGIAPGVVEWPEDLPEAERRKYLSRVPLRRAGTPRDVAALVRFLVTEGAYVTGQVIRLDGGRSIA